MRIAVNLLSLVLVLTGGLAAQTGRRAAGTVALRTVRGTNSGTITLDVLDAAHCRARLDFSRPGRAAVVTVVLSGQRRQVVGPQALVEALALPEAGQGCALAPRGTPDQPGALTIGGLTVEFQTVAPELGLTLADFELPPPPAPRRAGWGQ